MHTSTLTSRSVIEVAHPDLCAHNKKQKRTENCLKKKRKHMAKLLHCVRTACALRGHCVHTVHAEAGILTQEYLSPDWLHSEAAKPT